MAYRVLVCGGRNFRDKDAVWKELDRIKAHMGYLCIIQGGADGADELARRWATEKQHWTHLINEPADWSAHGRAAGPIRNQRMIDTHKPDVVVAFPGSRGTEDMVRRAKAAGIPVLRPLQ